MTHKRLSFSVQKLRKQKQFTLPLQCGFTFFAHRVAADGWIAKKKTFVDSPHLNQPHFDDTQNAGRKLSSLDGPFP